MEFWIEDKYNYRIPLVREDVEIIRNEIRLLFDILQSDLDYTGKHSFERFYTQKLWRFLGFNGSDEEDVEFINNGCLLTILFLSTDSNENAKYIFMANQSEIERIVENFKPQSKSSYRVCRIVKLAMELAEKPEYLKFVNESEMLKETPGMFSNDILVKDKYNGPFHFKHLIRNNWRSCKDFSNN